MKAPALLSFCCAVFLGCSPPLKTENGLILRPGEDGPHSLKNLFGAYHVDSNGIPLMTYTLENRFECPVALQIPITDDALEVKCGDKWLSKPYKQSRDLTIIPPGAQLRFVTCPLLYNGKCCSSQTIRFVFSYFTVESRNGKKAHRFQSDSFQHPCISGHAMGKWDYVFSTNTIPEFKMPCGTLSEVAYALKWDPRLFVHDKIGHYSIILNSMEDPLPFARPVLENCLPRPIPFSETYTNLNERQILNQISARANATFLQTDFGTTRIWLVDNWYQTCGKPEKGPSP